MAKIIKQHVSLLFVGLFNMCVIAQDKDADYWPAQHYGVTIPPTNTTLLKQEHDRQEVKHLENINNIVERVVHEELDEQEDRKESYKKQKKRKKKHYKNHSSCNHGKSLKTQNKAIVDLLVPEIRLLLERQYDDAVLTEKKVTIKLHDVNLRKAIELMSKLTGVNFIMDADVEGYVRNFSFHEASLAAVLAILLSNNIPRLALIKERDVWRILKHSTAIEECKVKAERSIEQDTVSAHITMHHATWSAEFKKRIEQLWQGIVGQVLIKSHYVVFDDESRNIFCRGRKHFVADFKKALKEIDTYVPQVRIDARVVLASHDFEESIGCEWSGVYDRSANICDKHFSFAGIGIGSKSDGTDTPCVKKLLGWSLNFLPEKACSTAMAKIPLIFGNKNLSTERLNFMLNAAENKKQIETILKPSLLIKSQEFAEILVGEEMPQETRLQETVEGSPTNVTTISYKDIGMKIKVKPVVSPDQKNVYLDIFVQNSYVNKSSVPVSDSSNASRLGSFPYTIVTSRSTNRVVLRDGQTTMISGLIENTKKTSQSGVPWIQEIPVLGWMFKGRNKHLVDKQLLVFITPTLV